MTPSDTVILGDKFVRKNLIATLRFWVLAVTSLPFIGCAGSTHVTPQPAPLSADKVNLVFVVSEDLAYHAPGDVDPNTANLTNQGLERSLLMGADLRQQVLGGADVTAIYGLEAMTHLQAPGQYPDVNGLETIEQFAMLSQITIPDQGELVTANSFPIYDSYASGSLPANVAQPVFTCSVCQGLDFTDENSDNEAFVEQILQNNVPGFYIFSAPWETAAALMTNINKLGTYGLAVPADYAGPNYIYAISIASGGASLITYNSNLTPSSAYPVLPPLSNFQEPCNATHFNIAVTAGADGAVLPSGINTNETIYFIRHAEAHPAPGWDDGNYIAAGQWRALYLPEALAGKIHPTQVYSIDPADIPGTPSAGAVPSSYVRPALTVEPYAIANHLPLNLAASTPVFAQNPPQLATDVSNYFFTGGQFSNQTLLVAWEHNHIPPTVNALLASYNSAQTAPRWPSADYDTIWTIKLDFQGNLTVDNNLCEGINSDLLPAAAPSF